MLHMEVDPTKLFVVHYPAPVLRSKAEPIEVTDNVREVARVMVELMRRHEGIGLAAPQVGLPWRMFVTHVPASDDRDAHGEWPEAQDLPEIYINPVLKDPSRELEAYEEGCLSLPDIRGRVSRPERITIEATGLSGKRFTKQAAGLLARCWQHEMDHLDGVLIIDRMSQIYRLKNRSAIRDLERQVDVPRKR